MNKTTDQASPTPRARSRRAPGSRRAASRGISLIFALLAMVTLMVVVVALMRTVGSGALVIGNLSFKEDATSTGAVGAEQAMAYLTANAAGTVLNADHTAVGYYSTSLDNLDVTGGRTSAANKMALVDWLGDGSCSYVDPSQFDTSACLAASPAVTVNGNTVRWIIMRLCSTTGAVSASNQCSKPASTAVSTSSDRGEISGGGRITSSAATPYYRIVVRTQGPRNTVSYTETVVHF